IHYGFLIASESNIFKWTDFFCLFWVVISLKVCYPKGFSLFCVITISLYPFFHFILPIFEGRKHC
ncbi:MAG: hypothetical protein DRG73_00250, partial [Deltaproteobacteria bacterium]